MYSYDEIQYQNQQDCFTSLFYTVSSSLLEVLGRKGETVVRKSVAGLGRELGEKTRDKIREEGGLPNLKALPERQDVFVDPRFRFLPIRLRQQELWLEVHTCPIADFMKQRNADHVGLMFCEEFCHAFFEGYTDKIAQSNLSKTLMGPYDNHCRFSIYYRPANLPADQRECVFDADTTTEEACVPEREKLRSQESVCETYLTLYKYFYETAVEIGGEEGRNAVAMGLRKLAAAQKADLEKWAKARREACDETFLAENFPVPLADTCSILEKYISGEEADFFRKNFLARF